MIRKLLTRAAKVFRRRPVTAKPSAISAQGNPRRKNPLDQQAAIITQRQHGIRRETLSSGALRTCETLQRAGFQAYVVGGAVRDLIIGGTPKDFDIATNATPDEVRGLFRRARIIGRRFQIVHVMQGGETLEVSTFRAAHDQNTQKDEHGRVLRDNVWGSQAEDAARRDFTVNALYYNPVDETVIDYHHGVADLRQKTLRMIGEPRARYREDPVRMLRAVRLAAKLGLEIDPAARTPIREMADLLENIPSARVFDEMLKLLFSGQAIKCLERLREEGLHHGLLPLLDVIFAQPEDSRFVRLALENTDQRIHAGKPTSPGFLFATLLWNEVLKTWHERQNAGELPIPALLLAMDTVLEQQASNLAITRRISGDIKDIWALQPRFEKRSGKTPWRLIEQPRFRAAYDFLLLRAQSGEIPLELADWWTSFQEADNDERTAMLLPASTPAKKRRRKSRSRSAKAQSAAADSATGSSE